MKVVVKIFILVFVVTLISCNKNKTTTTTKPVSYLHCSTVKDLSGKYKVNVKLYSSYNLYGPGNVVTGSVKWDTLYVDTLNIVRLNNEYAYSMSNFPNSASQNPHKATRNFTLSPGRIIDLQDLCNPEQIYIYSDVDLRMRRDSIFYQYPKQYKTWREGILFTGKKIN